MKKIEEIIMSLALLFVGVSLFLWADKVTNLVSIILGVIMLLYSGFLFISIRKNVQDNKGELTLAIILLIGGIVLLVKPEIIKETISFVIGIFILFSSISKLNVAINTSKTTKNKKGVYLSIIGIILGLLCLLGKLIIPDLVLKFVGFLVIVYSISNIINTVLLPKNNN
ncbi:MAG: DUF308 domain-containing protein [Bacilli bacterium]|nr:DUF308 domain-containing protein [Bacilli bacterium]